MDENSDTNQSNEFHLPFNVRDSPFARYSITNAKDNESKAVERRVNHKKAIIIGQDNVDNNIITFYEIIISEVDNTKIEIKSFYKDYNKKNANLNQFRAGYPSNIFSLLTKDNKYIIVFRWDFGYNVYDIDNDKWLLAKCDRTIDYAKMNARIEFIKDEIIMITCQKEVYFYSVANLKAPKKIKFCFISKNIRTNYVSHGLSCIDFKSIVDKSDHDENINSSIYNLSFVMFASYNEVMFTSFIKFDVSISVKTRLSNININDGNNVKEYKIIEFKSQGMDSSNFKVLGCEKEKMGGFGLDKNARCWGFGYESIYNSKNEACIAIIGGVIGPPLVMPVNNPSIVLFNIEKKIFSGVSHDMFKLSFDCDNYPATIILDNKLIVLQTNNYKLTNIIVDLAWKIERLIWIGYFQNGKKKNKDVCLLNTLPKDIVRKILKMLQSKILDDTCTVST